MWLLKVLLKTVAIRACLGVLRVEAPLRIIRTISTSKTALGLHRPLPLPADVLSSVSAAVANQFPADFFSRFVSDVRRRVSDDSDLRRRAARAGDVLDERRRLRAAVVGVRDDTLGGPDGVVAAVERHEANLRRLETLLGVDEVRSFFVTPSTSTSVAVVDKKKETRRVEPPSEKKTEERPLPVSASSSDLISSLRELSITPFNPCADVLKDRVRRNGLIFEEFLEQRNTFEEDERRRKIVERARKKHRKVLKARTSEEVNESF